MTHDEFWRLYDSGEISVKVYSGKVGDTEKSVEAFEYGGKFFLRIHNSREYVTGTRAWGKRYRMTNESHVIKEFDSKRSANAYFKKAAAGLVRVDI